MRSNAGKCAQVLIRHYTLAPQIYKIFAKFFTNHLAVSTILRNFVKLFYTIHPINSHLLVKNLFLFISLLLLSLTSLADRRSEADARDIAAKYFNLPAKSPKFQGTVSQSDTTVAPYYIYNSDEGGFVVVSGSDRLPEVIGYCDEGHLDPSAPSMPDNIRYWLEYAAQATILAEEGSDAITSSAGNYGKDYAPLLGDINFNQDFPYNKQCPEETFTGCMATAMSQVLAYHRYPQRGQGTASVVYNGRSYSADLGARDFDWDNILPAYKGVSATQQQQDAVAQLHYYVGLALELHYGTDATAGVSTKYATALRDNFGYNKNVCIVNRDCFTYGEWIDLLLNEFENRRPVLYDGVSGSGGHAFVIDGYRAEDGLFHVNWGWGSTSNGYYNITLLNPSKTGIGASLSGGFTAYQDAIINITPEQGAGTYYVPLYSYANGGITSASIGKTIPAGYEANIGIEYMANYTDKYFSGRFGVVIMQDGEEMERMEVGSVSGRASTFDVNNEVSFYGNSWRVPSLPDGDYRVYVYVEQEGFPSSILHTQTSRPNYINMYMREGVATFSMDRYYPTDLKVEGWNFLQRGMTLSDNCITVDVTNMGSTVENGCFSIQFDAPHRLTQVLKSEEIRILPGETRTLRFWTDMLEYGTYTINGLYMDRQNNGGKVVLVDGALSFNIYRDLETTRLMLRDRLTELQNIINSASYGNDEGQYPTSSRDKMQSAIDEIGSQDYYSMEVAEVQQLYDRLDASADEFFRSMNFSLITKKWSYVGDAPVNTGWSGSYVESPVHFGITMSASELAPYRGGKIVGISALFGRYTSYQNPQPEDLTTQVLLLDYNGHPGQRVLASSDNFHPNTQVYDDYYFNEPYIIGDEGITAVCKVIMHKSYYATIGACKDVAKPGACWMNNGSGWEDIYYTYGNTASGLAMKVIIQGGEANIVDAVLENVSAEPVMINDDITVKGYIKNAYHKDIERITIQWTMDDGTLGNTTIEQHIEPEAREQFSITLPGFSKAKMHTVQLRVITIDGMNDMVESNSNVRVSIPVTEKNYERHVVVEDHVSNECPYSPRSIGTYESMKQEFGDNFIGISVHTDHDPANTDPMVFPGNGYSPLLLACPTTPSGLVNRKTQLYSTIFADDLRSLIEGERRLGVAQVTAQAAYNASTQKITVQANTEFGYDYSNGDYRLCYVIVEDQVGPYNQRGIGTVLHDNVAREIVPDYKGVTGALPQYAVAGHKYEYTCRFSMPDNVDHTDNVRIICLLLDGNSGAILNATDVKLTTNTTIDDSNIDDLDGEDEDDNYGDDGGDSDDDDDDDDEFEFDNDGLPVIKINVRDGEEFDNTADNLYTDIINYKRYDEHTQWQPLYVPFGMEYSRWKKYYEIAEYKEVRQFDYDDDGIADSTVLRFELIGDGGEVVPNKPYLIRAKQTGEHEITLYKKVIYVTKRNDISDKTDYSRIDLKGTYTILPDIATKGYYIHTEADLLQQPQSPDAELGPMRWYMTITDPVTRQTYAPGAARFFVGTEFMEDDDPMAVHGITHTPQSLFLRIDGTPAGTSLRALPRGVYIHQGRKVYKP